MQVKHISLIHIVNKSSKFKLIYHCAAFLIIIIINNNNEPN